MNNIRFSILLPHKATQEDIDYLHMCLDNYEDNTNALGEII